MKRRKWICCGILRKELENVFEDLGTEVDVNFLPPGLHVDYDKLEHEFTNALTKQPAEEVSALIYGTQCHPDIARWRKKHDLKQPEEPDCIGILLGREKRQQLSRESKTFFLTPGWLEHWKEIFIEGLGWDEVDARMNFGIYDRVLLLDTGVGTIEDEKVLEFFDYTQVPIEVYPIDLSNLKRVVQEMLGSSE